jgi:hypothetical protein
MERAEWSLLSVHSSYFSSRQLTHAPASLISHRRRVGAIEDGRFPLVLQLANQLLKRDKGTEEGDTAASLKALALIKMDRASAAEAIINEVSSVCSLCRRCRMRWWWCRRGHHHLTTTTITIVVIIIIIIAKHTHTHTHT